MYFKKSLKCRDDLCLDKCDLLMSPFEEEAATMWTGGIEAVQCNGMIGAVIEGRVSPSWAHR